MTLPLIQAKTEHFVQRGYGHLMRGVVHVGAHEGQEIPWYLHKGNVPVWAFEPHPEAYRTLCRNVGNNPAVVCANVALAEINGFGDLMIPIHLHDDGDDSQSASLLLPDRDSGYGWGDRGRFFRKAEVWIRRFDDWAAEADVNLISVNTLVVDVQGLELQVLKGFGDTLWGFDFLNIECSSLPIYRGGAAAQQVVGYLLDHGFKQDSPIVEHDDILFIRRGL